MGRLRLSNKAQNSINDKPIKRMGRGDSFHIKLLCYCPSDLDATLDTTVRKKNMRYLHRLSKSANNFAFT